MKPGCGIERFCVVAISLTAIFGASFLGSIEAQQRVEALPYRYFAPRRDGRRTSVVVTPSIFDRAHHHAGLAQDEPVDDDSDTVIRKIRLMRMGQEEQQRQESSNSAEAPYTIAGPQQQPVMESTQPAIFGQGGYPAPTMNFFVDKKFPAYSPHTQPVPQQFPYHHQQQQQYQLPMHQHSAGFWQPNNDPYANVQQFNHHHNPYRMVKKHVKHNDAPISRSKQKRRKASSNQNGSSGFVRLDTDENSVPVKGSTWPSTPSVTNGPRSVLSSSMKTKDYSYGYTVQSQNTRNHVNSDSQRTPDGSVKGHYSFVDADGNLHVTEYAAGGKDGYQAKVYTIKNYDPSRRRSEDLAGTNPTLVTPSLRSASKEVSAELLVRKDHNQQPHPESATLVTFQSTPVQDLVPTNNLAFQQFRAALDMKTPQQQLVHTEKPTVIDVLRKSAGIPSGEDVNSPDIKTPVMSNKVLKDSSEEDSGEAPSISQANQQLGAITEMVSHPEPVFEEVPRQPPNSNPGKMVYKPILTAAGPFSNINGKRRIGSSLGKIPEQHIDLRKKGRRPSESQAGYHKHGQHQLQREQQQQQVFTPANNRIHSSSLFGAGNSNDGVSVTPSLLEHPAMQNAMPKNHVPSVIKDSLDVSGASAELPLQACQLPGQKGCSTSTSDEDVGGTPSLVSIHASPKKPSEMLQRTTLPTVLPDGVVFLVTHSSPYVPRPAFTKQTLPSSTNQQESSAASTFQTNGVAEKAKDSDEVKNGGVFDDDEAFLAGLIDPRPKTTQVKCTSSTKAGAKGKMSTSSQTSSPVTGPWSSISNSFMGFPTFGERIPAVSTKMPGITKKTSTSEGLKENPSLSASDPLNLLLPSISTHMTVETSASSTRKSKTLEVSRTTDVSKNDRVVEEESTKDQPNLKEIFKQQQLLKMKQIKDELKKKYTHFTSNSAEESKNRWPSTTDDEQPPTRDFFRTLGPKVTSTSNGGDVLDLASKLVQKIEAAAEQKILAKMAPTTTTTGWGTEVDSNRFVWGGSASRILDPAIVSTTHSTGTPMVKTYQLPTATPEEESESPEVTDASPLTGTTAPSNSTEGFNLGISSAVPSPMLQNSHSTFDIPSVNDQAMLSTLRHFTSLPKIPGSSSPAQKSLPSEAQTVPATDITQDLPSVSNRPTFQLQASSMQKTDMFMNEFQKMKESFRTKGLPTSHMPLPSAGVGQPFVMAMSNDQPRQNIMDPSSMLNFGHIQPTQVDTAMGPSTESTLPPSTTIAVKQLADPLPLNNGHQDIMTGLNPQSDLLVPAKPSSTELPASARTSPVTGSPVTNPATTLKPTEDTTTQPAETVMGMESTAKPKSKGRRRKSRRGKKPQTEPVGEGTTSADLKPESGKQQGAATPGQQAPAITDMASLMKNLMAVTLQPVTAPPASPETTLAPQTTSLAPTTTTSKQEEGITAAAAAGGVPLMPSGSPADGNQPPVVADKPAKKKSRKRSRKNKQKGVRQPQSEPLPATAPSAAGATNLVPASSPAALSGQMSVASNAASPQEAASLANTGSASIGALPSSLNSSALPLNKMSLGVVPTKS